MKRHYLCVALVAVSLNAAMAQAPEVCAEFRTGYMRHWPQIEKNNQVLGRMKDTIQVMLDAGVRDKASYRSTLIEQAVVAELLAAHVEVFAEIGARAKGKCGPAADEAIGQTDAGFTAKIPSWRSLAHEAIATAQRINTTN